MQVYMNVFVDIAMRIAVNYESQIAFSLDGIGLFEFSFN